MIDSEYFLKRDKSIQLVPHDRFFYVSVPFQRVDRGPDKIPEKFNRKFQFVMVTDDRKSVEIIGK